MTALVATLREMVDFWGVFLNLVARDLKVKYQTKSLGFLWSLIYPATMLGIWYIIFRKIARIDVPDYWAYLISGILPFQFIQNGISDGSWAIRRNAGIIRKVYVPMEILVVAGVTVKMIEFIMQMAVALLLLFALHKGGAATMGPLGVPAEVSFSLVKSLVVLPGGLLLLFVFVLGVSLPLSSYTVIYRDLDHMIGLLMTALFYMTPVFWSLTLVPHKPWMLAFALNPAMAIVDLFRGPLYWGTWPVNGAIPQYGTLAAWGLATVMSFGSLLIGYALFNRSKLILAEVV